MAWISWMRSRVLSFAVVAALVLPMGVPAAFAYGRVTSDELHQSGTKASPVALSAFERDLLGAKKPPKGSVSSVLAFGLGRKDEFTAEDVAAGVGRSVATVQRDLTELSHHLPVFSREGSTYQLSGRVASLSDAGKARLLRGFEGAYPGARRSLTPTNRARARSTLSDVVRRDDWPVDEDTGAYVHSNQFKSASELLSDLKPYVEIYVDSQGVTRMRMRKGEKENLRPLFANLAYDAVLQSDINVREAARWAIRELAPQYGVYSASARDYYKAMGRKTIYGRTMPAFNIRWNGFDMARRIFRAAKKTNAGGYFLEEAASEEGYTGPGHDYAGMSAESLAAAVYEGVDGPIFLKMDHTQVKAADYRKNPKAELAKVKAKITRGLEAGFMNVDLDTSTVEHEPRYVELEVTRWFVDALEKGIFDVVFNAANKKSLIDGLTFVDPTTGKTDVKFNKSMLDNALSRIEDARPEFLKEVTFKWSDGVAEKPLSSLVTAKLRADLQYEWDRLQQEESVKVYIELAEYTRREAKRIYGTSDVGLGAEVGEVGKKFNTTLSQIRAFLDMVFAGLREKGIDGPDVFSVQSGAAHGGQFDASGKLIRDVKVDWDLLKAVSEVVRNKKYNYIAGSEQHGFSTVAEAKLSELPSHGAAEVHLATEYANMLLYGIVFGEPFMAGNKIFVSKGAELTDEMKWDLVRGTIGEDPADEAERNKLFKSIDVVEVNPAKPQLRQAILAALEPMVVKAGMLQEDSPLTLETLMKLRAKGGKFKDVVKKIAGSQNVLELMNNLPADLSDALGDAWETKFVATFERTNATNTLEAAQRYALSEQTPAPRHPPLALSKALTAESVALATDAAPVKLAPELKLAAEATESVAALMVAEGIRGSVDPSDKAAIKRVGKKGDVRGKEIFARVFAARGIPVLVKGAEGVGRDALSLDESFDANEVINPNGLSKPVSAYIDVIENTKLLPNRTASDWDKLAPAISGTTSLAVLTNGNGIGNVTDNAYAGVFIGSVDPAKVEDYVKHPLNPHVETREEIEPQLLRLAKDAKGGPKKLSDMTVHAFNRPREQKRLDALRNIAADNPGMQIVWDYPDGTVRHNVQASVGKPGEERIHVSLMTSGPDEAAANLGIVKALSASHGAVGSLIFYSKNLPKTPKGGEAEQGAATDLSNGLNFDESDKAEWQRLRPNDWKSIVEDHKIFTIADWDGDVFAAIPAITNDRVFNLAGTADLGDGRYRVPTVYVQQVGDEPGRIITDVKDVVLSDVKKTLSRGEWAMLEPAAADLSAVDPDGHLLDRMEADETYTIALGNPETLSAKTPTLWIAIEQMLEQFKERRSLKSLEEAAKESAIKFVIDAGPTISKDERAVPVARVTLLSNADENARLAVDKSTKSISALFPDVLVRVSEYANEAASVFYLHVDFIGGKAAEAARMFLERPEVARLAQAAAETRVKRLFSAISASTNGAAKPQAGWFKITINELPGVDAAVGSRAWLKTLPEQPKEAEVAVDAPAEDNKLVSGAAAVVAAGVGRRDPALAKRLDISVVEDIYVPSVLTTTKETQENVRSYQKTVATVSGEA